MADLLSYRPSNSAVYYVPPRRIEPGKTLSAFACAAVATVVGAFLYAKVQPRITSVYIRVGAVAVAAAAVGLLALVPVRLGKVRISFVAAALGTLLSFVALYAMWLTWVHDVLLRFGVFVSYTALASHPVSLLHLIKRINATGTWSYQGNVARGVGLLIFWLGEAAMIVAAGVLAPIWGLFTSDPTCRECGARCVRIRGLPRFAAERQDELVSAVEGGDYAALASHTAPQHEDAPELSIQLMSCRRCNQTNVLTVNRIAWELTGGKYAVKTVPLTKQLLIPPDAAEQVLAVCHEIQAARDADPTGDESEPDLSESQRTPEQASPPTLEQL